MMSAQCDGHKRIGRNPFFRKQGCKVCHLQERVEKELHDRRIEGNKNNFDIEYSIQV